MHRYLYMVVLFAITSGMACDDTAPDGTGLVIEILAEQPDSAGLGVSLAFHARGGGSVFASVEQGVFVATCGPEPAPPSRQAGCLASTTSQPIFTCELSVRPADEEALLFVALYAQGDCMGEVVQSRIVAVRSPIANPIAADAGAARMAAR